MSALPIVESLKLKAALASDISRQMAEAKSLRQESNTGQRTDLYMWATPEQTTEGKAADLITELYDILNDIIWNGALRSDQHERLAKANAVLAKVRGR